MVESGEGEGRGEGKAPDEEDEMTIENGTGSGDVEVVEAEAYADHAGWLRNCNGDEELLAAAREMTTGETTAAGHAAKAESEAIALAAQAARWRGIARAAREASR